MTSTSRPDLGWDDLAGLQVGIWGLGVEGRANLARAEEAGAHVVLVDDRPPPEGVEEHPVLATDAGGLDELAQCDVVVKSPGISRYRHEVVALQVAGVPIAGGLGLWLRDAPLDRVVALTGTKGKSTTSSVLGHLLQRLGRRIVLGGNLGTPPWAPAGPGSPTPEVPDLWVIEVSSYQATDLPVSPPLVAVTSLDADHLDWHGSVERYVADKLSLCTQPGADLTVAADTDALRARRPLLGPRVDWVDGPPAGVPAWSDALGLLGQHNRRNAEVARACLGALGEPAADDPAALAELADGFTPLASRLTPVARVDGVDFVDDSLSTNVLPTVAAVAAFAGRRLALLVGGYDRGIDYSPLAEPLRARAEATLVLALPDSGPRIRAELAAAGVGPSVDLRDAADLAEATVTAFEWARPDGVVLLSPAAPSFGRFRDYRDRAEAFTAAALACGG